MAFPNVSIEEIIDGPRPVRNRSLNRVVAVGPAYKGLYKQIVLVSDDDTLAARVGRTLDVGSVGLQCALDEGASDLGLVRVMGAARVASAYFDISGTGTVAGNVKLTLTDGVDTWEYTTALTVGEAAASIEAELIALIGDDATAPVVGLLDPLVSGRVVLKAKVAGLAANDIAYEVELLDSADGLTLGAASGNLQGGLDGPAKAEALVGDLRLECLYEGIYGNTVKYKFVPGTVAGTVVLSLEDGDAVKESFTLQFTADNLINGNELAALRGSAMVRGFFEGDLAAPVLPTGTAFMAGGSDGSPITDDDYIEGLLALGKVQANIVFVPGKANAAIRGALIAHAENASILDGLRIAVINAPRGMTVAGAATAAQGVDSKHAVMVAGWCTYASQPRLASKSVSPDGFYAGHLAATAAHVSPAARSSSRFFSTIIDVDTESSVQAFNAYTDGRLEAIILDPAANAFHCLNGRTLANDPAHYYVCIRRMSNQIQTDIFFASQPYKSEPKTDSLLGNVSGMVNSYLSGLSNTGRIKGGSVSGSQATATGIRIDFRFFPIYPADSIEYGMHRLAVDI